MLAKPARLQRGHQEVAGGADAVAGEDAAGAVGAVRRGRQAEDQHARLRIAETRAPAGPSTSSSRCAAFLSAPPRWQ